ncbi:MAG: aminotransferase class V-fold PLP-dependent enzyme [Acidobacteriota bacterium]
MAYLDNNSTTHPASEVQNAMASVTGVDLEIIEETRRSTARLLGARAEEIFFSTSGTDSIRTAFKAAFKARPGCRHVIASSIEHDSVLDICRRLASQGFRVTLLDVDERGRIDVSQLERSLSTDTALVSITQADPETGIIFPVKDLAYLVHRHSAALVHSDGAAAAGKMPIELENSGVDLYSISGRKFNGPDWIGALYVRQTLGICSAGSERDIDEEFMRSIAGLGAAARKATEDPAIEEMRRLRDRLEDSILSLIPDAYVNGTHNRSERLVNTSSIAFENANGELIAERLAELGTTVSTASACGRPDRSNSGVLQALNIPYARIAGSIRFSLDRYTTDAGIGEAIDSVQSAVAYARRFS